MTTKTWPYKNSKPFIWYFKQRVGKDNQRSYLMHVVAIGLEQHYN